MKKVVYLYKSGNLKRKDNSLVLESKDKDDYIPIEQVDMIICFSEVSLNKRVLALLNKYEVSILFYNFYGIGDLLMPSICNKGQIWMVDTDRPFYYKDGRVLVNQVNKYRDESQRLYISKSILKASIKNMLSVLKYYRKKGKNLDELIKKLEDSVGMVPDIETMNELMLIEANAKQTYYKMFDVVLENENFKFQKRTKNPPQNEVNAMLSYGYALLYGIILSILDRSSLFPQISFIHSLSKNSDSLQYDLADIFKPVYIDRMVLRLIRKKQIKQSHFEYKPVGRCYLNKEGTKLFIEEFNNLLQSTIIYSSRNYSYRSILSKEVHRLSEYIKDKSCILDFLVMKW